MTSITKDFDEIFLHPTPKGMAFSKGGDEQVAEVYLRALIEANARDDWHIEEVHMITFGTEFYQSNGETQARSTEYVHVLEGDLLEAAKDYLYTAKEDALQEKVDWNVAKVPEAYDAPVVL